MVNLRGLRRLRYEDLFPGSDCRDWHHYAIVWDEDGIADIPEKPRKALYIDGKLIPNIQIHNMSVENARHVVTTPMLLSFTHDPSKGPSFCTKSPFLIDEFKIWNHAKTTFK